MIRLAQTSLSSSAVHVWTLNVSSLEGELPKPQELLSSDELLRWQRFQFAEDKRRFAVTRQALRILLGGYLQENPRSLTFQYSSAGKPALAQPASDLRFNVAHSKECAIVAVTRNCEVGVDVEYMREGVEIEELAVRFFSLYEQQILQATSSAERLAAFFKIWTVKEAFIKALGVGLSYPLSSFDMGLESVAGSQLIVTRPQAADAKRWRVVNLPAPGGYAAALATDLDSDRPKMFAWQTYRSPVVF